MVQIGKSYIDEGGAICRVKAPCASDGYVICTYFRINPNVCISGDVAKSINSLKPIDDECAAEIWQLADKFISDCRTILEAYALPK